MSFEDSWAVVYAGFWRRLAALLVDILVWLPFLPLVIWISPLSKLAAIGVDYSYYGILQAYTPYFHARWGQTIGKMAAGIKVVKLNGEPIGWREALIRSSVDITTFIFGLAAS